MITKISRVIDASDSTKASTYMLTGEGVVKSCILTDPILTKPTTLVDNNLRSHVHTFKDPTGRKFVDFSQGFTHMMYINDEGKLFGSGINKYGCLTGSKYNELRATPVEVKVPNNEKVKKVFAMKNTTHILTEDGDIYGVGLTQNGQLGIRTKSERSKWVKPEVPEGTKFVDMIAPQSSSTDTYKVYAKTDKGDIYSWGDFSREPVKISQADVKVDYDGEYVSKTPTKDLQLEDGTSSSLRALAHDTLYFMHASTDFHNAFPSMIGLKPYVSHPGIKKVCRTIISTENGKLYAIEKKDNQSNIRGAQSRAVALMIRSEDGFDGLDKNIIQPEPKELVGVIQGINRSDRLLIANIKESTFAFTNISTENKERHIWRFDPEVTMAISAATETFMEYPTEFIAGIIATRSC